MDDDEDPVEIEVPVYLSKDLEKNLYLLQYPIRPSYMTYDNVDLLAGRVKPNQNKLELEVSLNTQSKHYAKSKGEQFALNVDGRNPAAASFYSSNLMDKQVLSSHVAGGDRSRYAVGYYIQGEIYLSPVHAQVQMRPNFNYLDKSDTRAESKLAAQEAGDSSQDEMEEEVRAVTVKFKRPESDAAKARRLASFDYLHEQQEKETWVPLRFHNTCSTMAEKELHRFIPVTKEPSNEFHVDTTNYLKMLVLQDDAVQQEMPPMPNNMLSRTQLKTMALGDHIKTLLTNSKVIRFSQLMHHLPQGTDTLATLRALQIVATMVQGCWVVKSEILYPKDVCSPNSGISSELLCRGRDFVMWRFTQSRCVTRKEISLIIKLPSEDVKDILEQMSHIKFNLGWEFKFPHDYDFTDRYPEVVERQTMLWDAKYQTLSKQLNITEAQERKIKEIAAAEAQAERPRRRRTSSRSRKRTLSGRSISDHSDMEVDQTDVDLTLKENQSKTVSNNDHRVLNGTTLEISDSAYNDNHETMDLRTELTEFIRDKLFSRYVLSMSELTRLLNVKLTQSSPGHVLGAGVTENLCEQIVIELGGVSLNAKWQEEKIFLHVHTRDDMEPIRLAVLELLKKSHKVLKKSVIKLAESSSGSSVSDGDAKNVIKDYCLNKNAQWFLKCCVDMS